VVSEALEDALEQLRACLDRPEEASEEWLLALDAALCGMQEALCRRLDQGPYPLRGNGCSRDDLAAVLPFFHANYLLQTVTTVMAELRGCREGIRSPVDAVRHAAMAWVWTWAAEFLVTTWDFLVISGPEEWSDSRRWNIDHHAAGNWVQGWRRDVPATACQPRHGQGGAGS